MRSFLSAFSKPIVVVHFRESHSEKRFGLESAGASLKHDSLYNQPGFGAEVVREVQSCPFMTGQGLMPVSFIIFTMAGSRISHELNGGVLPGDYYAMAEQHTSHFGPDVLTLQSRSIYDTDQVEQRPPGNGSPSSDGGVVVSRPKAQFAGETDLEFYRRKQNVVAVRRVSGDRLVAIVEIVSQGNKSSQAVFRKFVDKAVELLSQDIHLLLIDLIPPTRRDPHGIHGAIWKELTDEDYEAPAAKPLTLAAYEAEMGVRTFVEAVAVGDALPEMPLFLRAGGHVPVDLESTYQSAWEAVPRRWRSVIEG